MMEICNWTSKTVPRIASEETPGELEVCEWSDEASIANLELHQINTTL